MSLPSSNLGGRKSGRRRLLPFITFCGTLLLAGSMQQAKAGLVGYYAFGNFNLTNTGGFHPNGSASSPDSGTLVLTGTNDGSGLPGTTQITIPSLSGGWLQFNYLFATSDAPTYEYAGYVLAGGFNQFADTNGESGSVTAPLVPGEVFGFYVGSVDNTGGAGVLTITDFSAPVPEPSSLRFILIAAIGAASLSLRRHRISAGVLAVMTAGLCWTNPAAAQTQVYYSGINVTGQLALTTVVNASKQAQPLKLSGALRLSEADVVLKARPRMIHRTLSRLKMIAAADAADTLGLSVVSPSGITGFNALSQLDQREANNGNQFTIEPPSPSVAVGNGYVLEGVNNAIQIFQTSGAPVLPMVISTNQLFGLAPAINYQTTVNGVHPQGVYLTDMRVFFDPDINRWMVLERAQDNDIYGNPLNSSHLYFAVSQTSDPTQNYYIYVMNTTNGRHQGCPCIDDYLQIGADQYGFHIAWNEFNAASEQFNDASILAISKAALGSGSASPTALQFLIPYVTGYEFAIQPATTPPGAANFLASGGLEYFVSSFASAQGSQVAVWALYNTSSLAIGTPSAALTRIVVPTLVYASPDVATQPAGPTPYGSSLTPPAPLEFLDGGDTRVQSLTYSSGHLYLTLPTGINDQNGKWVIGGAYIVLTPTYRAGVLAAEVLNEGYLLVNNNHLLRPAIAVNAQGYGAIAVTLVGSGWFPSAALIPFATSVQPTTIEVAAAGALPEDGFTGYYTGNGDGVARWGDYSTAVVNSDGAIWMVTEYIGSYPRTTAANWNTYVARYHN